MVEHSPELDAVFHALSDPTRRGMLAQLAEGPRSVGDLAAPHAMSLAAASKHVRVLEEARLLQREVQGRVHLCRLTAAPLGAASDYLQAYAKFWSQRFDALERVLLAEAKREAESPRSSRKRARITRRAARVHSAPPKRRKV